MKFFIFTFLAVMGLIAWLWFGQLTDAAYGRVIIGCLCALIALVIFGWLIITGKVDR